MIVSEHASGSSTDLTAPPARDAAETDEDASDPAPEARDGEAPAAAPPARPAAPTVSDGYGGGAGGASAASWEWFPFSGMSARQWLIVMGAAVVGGVLGMMVGLPVAIIAVSTTLLGGDGLGVLAGFAAMVLGAFVGTVAGAVRAALRAVRPGTAPPSFRPSPPLRTPPAPSGTAPGKARTEADQQDAAAPAGSRADGPPGSATATPRTEHLHASPLRAPSFLGLPRLAAPGTPNWALPAIAATALLAAVALPFSPPGLGAVLVASALAGVALLAARHRITWWTAVLGTIGCALTAVPLFLDADWLVTPSVLAGAGIAAVALSGVGRGWLGVLKGGMSVPAALPYVPGVLGEAVRVPAVRRPRKMLQLGVGIGLTLVLLPLFGALFASADPVFSALVTDLLTATEWIATLPVRILVFLVVAVLAAAVVIAAVRPMTEPTSPRFAPRLGRAALLPPLVMLDLLFAVFVAVQVTVLFGGDQRVLSTAGLTYAEYARQGFFQLVVVSVFVLAIVAFVSAVTPDSGRDRWALAVPVGILCALTVVILASALHRLGLYTDVYGLTRLRASVQAAILWLGAVFALVLAAGAMRLARRPGGWLPRALLAVTGAGLVAFAVWNPDLRVAETQIAVRGVDRLDADYLGDLGAEAVPALDRLPEPLRTCVLAEVVRVNDLDRPDPWNGWNLARARAREILAQRPLLTEHDCSTITTPLRTREETELPR